jgi:mRNA interferase RelE/StbE
VGDKEFAACSFRACFLGEAGLVRVNGWEVLKLTSSAEKELKRLSSQLIARIIPRLENLASNQRPPGCKKLKGGEREWRIRVGGYRAVYTVDDTKSLVEVTRIRHRSEVYER